MQASEVGMVEKLPLASIPRSMRERGDVECFRGDCSLSLHSSWRHRLESFSSSPPLLGLSKRDDHHETDDKPDDRAGKDIRRIMNADVDTGEGDDARITEKCRGPPRQEVRKDHGSSEAIDGV